MDNLHNVLRTIRPDAKSRNHLDVFREFLDHLDRAARRGKRAAPKRKGARRRVKT